MSETVFSFGAGVLTGAIVAIVVARARGKSPRRPFVPGPAVLRAAIHHVVYEYSNLVHSGDYVANRSQGGPVGVHIGDMFLLNCRKFGDFYSTRPTDKPDVLAVHFCTRNPLPKVRLPLYNHWRPAMDKNLAHISYHRVTDPIVFYDGDNSKVVLLLQELREAFWLFLKHVDAEHKPVFENELKNRSATVGIQLP